MLPLVAVALQMLIAGCATTHVEVLAAIYHDSDGSAWIRESADYHWLRESIAPGRHVVVTPISDKSFFEAPLVDEEIPGLSLLGENPRQLDDLATTSKRRYDEAFAELGRRRSGESRTEIISAIAASGTRFAHDQNGTRKMLIVLSRGYEQSGIVDMNNSREDLQSELRPIIAALTKQGRMPELPDVKVCMGSVSVGLNGNASAGQFVKMEHFWREFFHVARATLVWYGPALAPQCLD